MSLTWDEWRPCLQNALRNCLTVMSSCALLWACAHKPSERPPQEVLPLPCRNLEPPPPRKTSTFDARDAGCPEPYDYCATKGQAVTHRLAIADLRRYAEEAYDRCGPLPDGGP